MASVATSNLRVVIVGHGSIGRRHCENLATLGVAQRIVVRRRESANQAFTPSKDVIVVHSVRESIAAGVDLAIVCNPTSLHVATAREYVAAGVPVLIEKPLAAQFVDAESFICEAEAAGAKVGMAYCMRYHPAYAIARDYIRSGRLGGIIRAKAWFESYLPDWHPWEDYRQGYAARAELGGGVLPTLDHEIDFINWSFGPPVGYSAASSRSGKLDIPVDDTAQLELHYPDHAVAISLSLAQRNRRRGFEFVGSEATLQFSFESQRLELSSSVRAARETLWHVPDFDLNLMYLEMLRDTLESVTADRPVPIPLRAGLDALLIASCPRRGTL